MFRKKGTAQGAGQAQRPRNADEPASQDAREAQRPRSADEPVADSDDSASMHHADSASAEDSVDGTEGYPEATGYAASGGSAAAARGAAAEAWRPATEEQMDEALIKVESCIHQYHGARLAVWTAEQQEVLRRAADLDRHALETQKSISETCLDGLTADLNEHRAAREKAGSKSEESIIRCEEDFMAELRMLGENLSSQVQELIASYDEKIAANGDIWVEGQWDIFDGQLRTILWKHARLLSGTGAAEGMAELYHEGALQPHLDAEKRGWMESQEQDLQLLQKEIDKEHKDSFASQAAKLKGLAPSAVLGSNRSAQLAVLAAEDQKRLSEIEAEVRSSYAAELVPCLVQAEEDYRGYDLELQNILIRTMRKRIADAAHMRQLKLALCRWRLDYQRVFHDHCNAMNEPDSTMLPAPAPPPGGAQEETARQLELVRQLVVDLWAKNNTPNYMIRQFLDKVERAARGAGICEPLAQVYQEELSQYGDLPAQEWQEEHSDLDGLRQQLSASAYLQEHADQPELLNSSLQTFGELGASRIAGIGSSHTSIDRAQ